MITTLIYINLKTGYSLWIRIIQEHTHFDRMNSFTAESDPCHQRAGLGVDLITPGLLEVDIYSKIHYIDVMLTTMASQITSLAVVYSIVYSDADQTKHQSSASLAFVWGIHRDRWIPRRKDQLRGKCFHLMTSLCLLDITRLCAINRGYFTDVYDIHTCRNTCIDENTHAMNNFVSISAHVHTFNKTIFCRTAFVWNKLMQMC